MCACLAVLVSIAQAVAQLPAPDALTAGELRVLEAARQKALAPALDAPAGTHATVPSCVRQARVVCHSLCLFFFCRWAVGVPPL